jgi:hypothetical protein
MTAHISRHHIHRFAAALLMLAGLVPCLANAKAADPGPTLSAAEARVVRALTATALARVAEARAALVGHSVDQAKDDLRQVRMLFELIKANMPAGETRALAHYFEAHLKIQDNREALPKLLPIYAALDNMPPGPGVDKARQDLNKAKNALENLNRKTAVDALDAMDKALSVDGVDLPLQAAEESLHQALNSFGKPGGAPQQDTLISIAHNLLQILGSAAVSPKR